MRKFILISALLLASASAQAASRGLVLAANDTPATTETAAPAAPEAAQPQAAKPAKKVQAKRHESDEAKARRIAARYGVSW